MKTTFPQFGIDTFCNYDPAADAIGVCPKHFDSIGSIIHELCERDTLLILRKMGHKYEDLKYVYWDIGLGWFNNFVFNYTHALSPSKGTGRHAC